MTPRRTPISCVATTAARSASERAARGTVTPFPAASPGLFTTLPDRGRGPGVETHLSECPACQERAAEPPSDTFVDLLRSVRVREHTLADTPGAGTSPSVTSAWGTPPGQIDAVPPAELADHPRYRLLRL